MHESYVYFFYKDQGTMIVEIDDHKRTTGNQQMLPSKRAKFTGYDGEIVHFADGTFTWSDKYKKYIRYNK